MLAITKQKLEILKDIFRLTSEQSKAIQTKKIKTFLNLSKEKRLLVKKIDELDSLFQKQYDAAKQPVKKGDFEQVLAQQVDIKEIQDVIRRIKTLTDKIKAMESRNKEAYNQFIKEMMGSINQPQINKQEKILRYKKMNDYKKRKK